MPPPAPIVIECNADVCRAGFAGELKPRVIFPSAVGRPNEMPVPPAEGEYTFVLDLYGEEALRVHEVLHNYRSLSWPFRSGGEREDRAYLWHAIMYKELRVDPAMCDVVMLFEASSLAADLQQAGTFFFQDLGVLSFTPVDALLAKTFSVASKGDSWLGGVVLASDARNRERLITRSMFGEHGHGIIQLVDFSPGKG